MHSVNQIFYCTIQVDIISLIVSNFLCMRSEYIVNFMFKIIIWIPFLIIFIVLAWLFMNSLPQHEAAAKTPLALGSYYYLESLGVFVIFI